VVVSAGDLWAVDVESRTAERQFEGICEAIPVETPSGWIFNLRDVALMRFGPSGLLWQTDQLALEGLEGLRVEEGKIRGLACFPTPEDDFSWNPFEVDLETGEVSGGWE
jgi:hypothetical protein